MTKRSDQITTVGSNLGKGLMPEEIIDLSLEGLAELFKGYEEDLGNGIKRRIKVIYSDERSLGIEVRLSTWREAEHHYRLSIHLEGLET